MRLLYLALTLTFFSSLSAQAPEQPNILFIIADDLNDYIEGLEGHPQVQTPNIKSLMDMGTNFVNGYSNSPVCANSRASFLTGKMPGYTEVMVGQEFNCSLGFDGNLPPENYFLTLPRYMKDSAGYFTFSLGKIFHCNSGYYDSLNPDPCSRVGEWNKLLLAAGSAVTEYGGTHLDGTTKWKWSRIDSDLVDDMQDYENADSIAAFLDTYSSNPALYCDKPFFLAYGIHKPHSNLYIPEQYYSDYYLEDFYAEPFVFPFNYPKGTFPPNGIIMENQPEIDYADYDSMLGDYLQKVIDISDYKELTNYWKDLAYLPDISPELTDSERKIFIAEAKKANGMMAYQAAVQFVDDMVGKVLDALATHPEIYNNTVVIFTSDHGYSFGEKKHWGKTQLFETDIRVPFVVLDLRNPNPQISTNPVSLIDLFPTISSLTNLPTPTMPDGSPYFDGTNLMPVVENANLRQNRPAVTAIINDYLGEFCNPMFSVRDSKYHYLQMRSNGPLGFVGCEPDSSFEERYLFDVGLSREIDPYEWNNLSEDSAYFPLMQYMSRFLPDSSLYLYAPYLADINVVASNCIADADDILKFRTKLLDPNGYPVSGPSLGDFTFTWTNSLTTDTSTGKNYIFNMASLSPEAYAAHSSLFVYLTVSNTATGAVVAFNLKEVAINPDFAPAISYSLDLDGSTATISGHEITGEYTSSSWQISDGFSSLSVPGPHTFATTGTWVYKNTVLYGNKANCKVTATQMVTIAEPPLRNSSAFFSFYPNPSTDIVSIILNASASSVVLSIWDMQGRLVKQENRGGDVQQLTMDVSSLHSGLYILQVETPEYKWKEPMEIMR